MLCELKPSEVGIRTSPHICSSYILYKICLAFFFYVFHLYFAHLSSMSNNFNCNDENRIFGK